ncbi:Putative exonuclease of the beta-lactamase fold involved in RNA processing [Idiomarina sp. A28L]|uniref:MBL fold metallo-hydrolase n=1 Tax=Idiomarina sp. A28L TaxID=1036674 RepID=UPI0002138AAB|nr:MBL fold metallo-hydrolase [Idiomarina sp. A28L]EGN75034.1 Putative exonuclease of the beta-lactamase fold involved in RNA processing [Idiomarina sp. A28L]
MRVVFLGGTETVTGSKYLVETENTRILIDCGLFQGYKWLRRRNWQPLPLDIANVDAVILTHAHLDHSGYVPVLYKNGFRGPVYAHYATVDLCWVLWTDSGRIQEEDAKYLGKHNLSKHEKPEPLYTEEQADKAHKLCRSVNFKTKFQVGDISIELTPVGHILGAASVVVEADGKRIGFSGDVGRSNDLLMLPPEPMPPVDVLLLESTYGDRLHDNTDPLQDLAEIITETAKAGGVLLIPSFAVGRAQLVQHLIVSLMDSGKIPRMPVFLDSPMAIRVSDIYRRHNKYHRLTAEQCARSEQIIEYTQSIDDSKAIAEQAGPHIIIAGSGMATGGRILHHFKHWLGDHRCTVLFSGYQAGGTRGAKMMQGVQHIKVHGEWLPVKAKIRSLDGLSAHADYQELADWLANSKLTESMNIQLIHGEPNTLETFRDFLLANTKFDVDIPDYMSILRV